MSVTDRGRPALIGLAVLIIGVAIGITLAMDFVLIGILVACGRFPPRSSPG